MFAPKSIIARFTGPWGVPIEIDSSILWLVGILVYFSLGGAGLVSGLVFAAVLFGSILLHELGHAWGCVVQGVPVRRIVLYGGGGFCERKVSATRRQQELIVLMGPLVNLALWALSGIAIWAVMQAMIAAGPAGFNALGLTGWLWSTLYMIGSINLALLLFNLIPVQPLDGGKLLQLWLARLMPADAATRVAGTIGFVLAILWIPAMIAFYFWSGWILFFFPSIRAHREMMKVRRAT